MTTSNVTATDGPLAMVDIDAALADVLEHEYDEIPEGTPASAHDNAPDPFVMAIPVSQLFADHTYQRELDTHRVDKMAANFQIALVGIIEVSARPDDRFAILDGQHRWATVRSHAFGTPNENPHVPCRVHTELTGTQEAELYHLLNTTRRQLTGWDRWVARRGAKDPVVMAIEDCAERNDVVIGMQSGPNVLRATRTCEKVVELGGIALLDEVLSIVRMTWPDDQAGLDAAIIHGTAHVLSTYTRAEVDIERLVTALAGVVPRQLTARAAAVRELHRGTMDRLVGHVIIERYNTVKGNRLAPFFERVKPLAKTVTASTKAKTARRDQILAWAEATEYPGRRKRLTPALKAAYDKAHGGESDTAAGSTEGAEQ